MNIKALYQIGDIVKVFYSNEKMMVTGYVFNDKGYLVEYELVPVSKILYCTENVITGLENKE